MRDVNKYWIDNPIFRLWYWRWNGKDHANSFVSNTGENITYYSCNEQIDMHKKLVKKFNNDLEYEYKKK